jgi:rod shape-determining protein MreD
MFLRNAALIAFGLALLVLQAAVGAHLPLYPLTPNLLLPIVIFLGVQQDVHLLRGAAISFVLGYLLDNFCGSPMGLSTFALVATFMAARGAGIRLFLRGALFQVALVFVAAMIAGGTALALRAIFSPPEAFPLEMPASGLAGELIALATSTDEASAPRVGSVVSTAVTLIASALATALCAPPIFAVVRRIDALRARRREAEGTQAA